MLSNIFLQVKTLLASPRRNIGDDVINVNQNDKNDELDDFVNLIVDNNNEIINDILDEGPVRMKEKEQKKSLVVYGVNGRFQLLPENFIFPNLTPKKL